MAHKYSAKKTVCNNGCPPHPSKKEAKRCDELHFLERAGEIRNLELQPVFEFVVNGEKVKMRNGQYLKYTADFQYFEGDKLVVEETKGMITADFRIRRALFNHLYPHTELRVK